MIAKIVACLRIRNILVAAISDSFLAIIALSSRNPLKMKFYGTIILPLLEINLSVLTITVIP